MRSLVGEWHAPLPNNETMIDIFRPIAFGTALLHEEWKNSEQLTATVFYVVGSELRADHYCDMGNQLRYVDESTDPQVLRFVLHDASNLDTHPRHFHSTTWRYVDAEHHVQDWEAVIPGKPAKTIRMDFKRVAAASTDPQAVVRADVQALNDGNAASLLALFAADARVFRVPQDRDRLTGDLSDQMGTQEQRKAFFGEMLARRPLARTELLATVAAGDLVAAKLKFINPDNSSPGYGLAIYRVRDGLIQDLWHLRRRRRMTPRRPIGRGGHREVRRCEQSRRRRSFPRAVQSASEELPQHRRPARAGRQTVGTDRRREDAARRLSADVRERRAGAGPDARHHRAQRHDRGARGRDAAYRQSHR